MLAFQVALVFLLSIVFISPAFADLNNLINVLPVESNLPSSWQLGEVYGGQNVQTTLSDLRPDIVNQKFFLDNDASSMTVELNVFEFDSESEATQTHKEYSEFLSKKFDKLELQGEQSESCIGISSNFGYVNEMATIVCTNNSFLVVSTAQQEGGAVFENGNQVLTDGVSVGFVTYVLGEISKISEPQIPDWIKNNALWWGQDKISDNEFMSGLQYLIQNNIIVVSDTSTSIDSGTIPYWVKNTALWWGEGKISDGEFIKSIEFLIENSFITI